MMLNDPPQRVLRGVRAADSEALDGHMEVRRGVGWWVHWK